MKTSYAVALLVGIASTKHHNHVPKSVSYFAEGVDSSFDMGAAQIAGDLDPEQVSVLETPKATAHTTFYGQQQKPSSLVQVKDEEGGDKSGPDPEKVLIVNEEYFRHRNDKFDSITNYPDNEGRTTFYTQITGDLDPEQVSVLETPKATAHTTFYGQKRPADVMNVQKEDTENPDTEKTVVLNEEYFRHRNDKFDSITNYPDNEGRTTFYAQIHDDLKPEKVSVLETPKATAHTTFYGQHGRPADAQNIQGEDEGGNPDTEKTVVLNEEYFRHRNDKFDSITNYPDNEGRTTFYTQITGDLDPEQVSVLETPKATAHTTFYGQKRPADAHNVMVRGEDENPDTEKTVVLNEEYFRHRNDKFDSITNYPDNQGRTTFYTQVGGDLDPEQVSVLETPKAKAHTTFYGQKKDEDAGPDPEKVHILNEENFRHRADKGEFPYDSSMGNKRTTFYRQKSAQPVNSQNIQDDADLGKNTEKVSILNEEYFRHRADLRPEGGSVPTFDSQAGQLRTPFYAQVSGDSKAKDMGPDPEKVTVLNEEYFRHRNEKQDLITNYPEGLYGRTTFMAEKKAGQSFSGYLANPINAEAVNRDDATNQDTVHFNAQVSSFPTYDNVNLLWRIQ